MQSKPNGKSRRLVGIEPRHASKCRSRSGGRCSCEPSYRAVVYDRRTGGRVQKTFRSEEEARSWRADAQAAVRKGALRAASRLTVRQAAEAMLEGMRAGSVRTRSGDTYKPSAIRSYDDCLRRYVLDELGGRRLADVQRRDVQHIADEMLAAGLDPSTIRNALMPLRVLYRRAVEDGEVAVNPCASVRLPAVRGRRDRIASPDEAAALIEAAPEQDRALWATAFYAGLRRGELMALRWEDVDLAGGVLRVERSWDVREGAVEPKSRAGRRSVPLTGILRDYLDEHKLRASRDAGLVFGRTETRPFEPVSVAARATAAWKRANAKRAEVELPPLPPVGLHEARHTYASLCIAAGVNAKALSTYMGHASVTITYDRYGHLLPGNEDEAARLLDDFLGRVQAERARQATAADDN